MNDSMKVRTLLLGGAALGAMGSAPAMAAQQAVPVATAVDAPAAPAADAAIDDDANAIIVTARRRAETLQNVPIAVTAFSGAQLERQGAIDITDIGNSTPNVTLEVSRGTNSTLTAFIRGVGQQDPVAGFEQGVGLYLDDVYLNRPQAAVLDIYEVERIEVLRGPQGTLYGRNTIGGAVKYVTKRLPDVTTFSIRGNVGTYRQADLITSVSAPIAPGLRIGGAFARLYRGGFGHNATTGKANYNKNVIAMRGTIEFDPSDALAMRVTGDYARDASAPRGGHREIAGLVSGTPVLANVYDSLGGQTTPNQLVKGGGVAAHIDFKVAPGLTLRSISAWRSDRSTSPIDFDSLPAVDIDVAGLYTNRQFSQEAQLLVERGALNGVLGAYYLNADARTAFDTRIFTTFAGLAASTDARIGTRTTAIFGDFSYDFTPQVSLSLGGRYTWDKRTGNIFRQNYIGGGSTLFGGAGIPFGVPATNFQGSRKFKRFTPRASLSFKPSRVATFYASYGQGFKGGSFDPRGVGVNALDLNGNGIKEQSEVAQFISFRPESVSSYEVGYKGSPLPGIDIAAALFHADYKDVQIPGSAPCTLSGIASFCGVTANAGKARFEGVELEGSARLARDFASPGDRLTLSGTMGYIKARYLRYVTLVGDVAQYRHVQNTPKWTASGTLAYNVPIGEGRFDVNSTLSYRTKTYQFEIANPFLDQKGYALLDANAVWKGKVFSVGLHAKNITDTRYRTSGYTFVRADPVTGVLARDAVTGNLISATGKEGTLTTFWGNPRQVWVSFGLAL